MLFHFPLRMARPLLVLSLLSLSVISCKKETQVPKVSPTQTEDIATLKSFLSEVTGTKIDKVIFNETKEVFVIDGDVVMTLKSAREHYAAAINIEDPGGRITQRIYSITVNPIYAPNITIYADPAIIPAAWQTAIDQAISNWNSTDCLFKLSRTSNASEATTTFYAFTDENTDEIASASLPYAFNPPYTLGQAGGGVYINLYYNPITASRKQSVVTHELGHTLGFLHTNLTEGSLIPETPNATDPNSIMHSTAQPWIGFTYHDIIAFGIIYPNAPNTKRFLRYYSSNNGTHMYTLSSTELNASGSSYGFEHGEGYMYTTQVTGTVPVYRYNNSSKKDHVYTTNFAELGTGANGYVAEGITGYIYPTQVTGTRPLYRYHNTNKHDHFYTVNINELGAAGSGGYSPENPFIIGYVY